MNPWQFPTYWSTRADLCVAEGFGIHRIPQPAISGLVPTGATHETDHQANPPSPPVKAGSESLLVLEFNRGGRYCYFPTSKTLVPAIRYASCPAYLQVGNHCNGQSKPGGPVPEGKAALMFEVTLITESANHNCFRVSLRSSSKQVPSNPSLHGVLNGLGLGPRFVIQTEAR